MKTPHNDTLSGSFIDKLLTWPQYLLPQHTLSVLMHRLTQSRKPWLKKRLIAAVIRHYQVDMREAAEPDPAQYDSFNAFFTRALKAGSRPLSGDEQTLISPVDGAISQLGNITGDQLFQAKGHYYSLAQLLGDDNMGKAFENGQFATIYLAPRDYHRIHMPLTGTLKQTRYLPGKLFSVNPRTARSVPGLFARNERLVCLFETQYGPMAVILVGAIFVGSMQTVWSGQVTPPYRSESQSKLYDDNAVKLARGDELGRFNMGSTVIVLMPPSAPELQASWQSGDKVRLGQALSQLG